MDNDTTWWTSGTSTYLGATTSNGTWSTWGATSSSNTTHGTYAARTELAQQQREAQRRRDEEAHRRCQRERQEADRRADALLRSELTSEQEEQLDLLDSFLVVSEHGVTYRIGRGREVEELDANGDPTARWCIHPTLSVPNGDTMLAQKLLLQCSEDEFRRIGNRTAL